MNRFIPPLLRTGCLGLLLLLTALAGHAQVAGIRPFTSSCPSSDDPQAFAKGCIDQWYTSHGNPAYSRNFNSCNMFINNQNTTNSVGIYTPLVGLSSGTYEFSLNVYTTAHPGYSARFVCQVVTGLTPGSPTAPTEQPLPSGVSIAWSSPTVTYTNNTSSYQQYFDTRSFSFTVPAAGNYQLWIRLVPDGSGGQVGVNFDGLRLGDANCPLHDVFYQNTSSLPAITRTQGAITASTAVQVLSSQNVVFGASKDIALLAGFGVDEGAYFEAEFVGVGCAYPRPAATTGTGAPQPPKGNVLATTTAGQTRLSLFPNPTSSVLTLALPANRKTTSIRISDLRGALVASGVPGAGEIDVSSLPTGVYLVHVSDGTQTYHEKFVKR